MVGFSKKKINSYTLGEKLKRMREEMRISIAEVSKNTRVKQDYLEKIEESDFESLPPDVYIKGFLKSYANFLGVNELEVIEQYKKERGIKDNIRKIQLPVQSKKRFNIPNITITPKFFTAVFIGLIVLGSAFYFYREIGDFSKDPRLVVMQPGGDRSVEKSSLEVVGITDKESKVFINDQPVFVNEKGEFNESLGLQNGMNKIVVRSVNKFGKEKQETFNVSADYEVRVAGAEEEQKDNSERDQDKQEGDPEKITLEIKAVEHPVWFSVEIDGKNTQSGTMLPESIQVFEADEKISVTSGKANRTMIKLNGKDIGPLGDEPGVIRDVIFNKSTKIENRDNDA